MGSGSGYVRDDVRPATVLLQGPRETVRAHSHRRHSVPLEALSRGAHSSIRSTRQGPEPTVGQANVDYFLIDALLLLTNIHFSSRRFRLR